MWGINARFGKQLFAIQYFTNFDLRPHPQAQRLPHPQLHQPQNLHQELPHQVIQSHQVIIPPHQVIIPEVIIVNPSLKLDINKHLILCPH